MGGLSIKLDRLYQLITESGGYDSLTRSTLLNIANALEIEKIIIERTSSLPLAILLIYEKYLKEFDIWRKNVPNVRKSARSRPQQQEPDYISSQLLELCEQKAKINGINSVYVSLASGFSNEIDLTLHVLLELSQNKEYIPNLVEMEGLYTLLPAVVGVFSSKPEVAKELSYLKELPHITEHRQFISNHTKAKSPSSTYPSGSQHFDKIVQTFPNEVKEIIEFRIRRVLIILLNLSIEEPNLKSDSPVLGLLDLCLNTDLPRLQNKAFRILSLLSSRLSVDVNCIQTASLIRTLGTTLNSRNRKHIIHSLKTIINLATLKDTGSDLFRDFDLTVLVELLGVLDPKIALLCLLALQALTLKHTISAPRPKLLTSLHALVRVVCNTFNPELFRKEPKKEEINRPRRCTQNTREKVLEWLAKNYTKCNDWRQSVTLYEVFSELRLETKDAPDANDQLLALLDLFEAYTPLLPSTFESYLHNNDETDFILANTTHFAIPYVSTKGPTHENTFASANLRNLQLQRIVRQSNGRNSLCWLVLNCERFEASINETSKHTSVVEIEDALGPDCEKNDQDSSTPQDQSREDACKEYVFAAANAIANLCHLDAKIRRYIIGYHLERMLEKNVTNIPVHNILIKIIA